MDMIKPKTFARYNSILFSAVKLLLMACAFCCLVGKRKLRRTAFAPIKNICQFMLNLRAYPVDIDVKWMAGLSLS
jgi:hypothetical protein